MHATPLANHRVSSDHAISTDVETIEILSLALFVGVVVDMAVLVMGELEARSVGTIAWAVAIFHSCLATAPFETRPPVVLAAPESQRVYIIVQVYRYGSTNVTVIGGCHLTFQYSTRSE